MLMLGLGGEGFRGWCVARGENFRARMDWVLGEILTDSSFSSASSIGAGLLDFVS